MLVWLKFYYVPLELWTDDGLSYVALHLDEFTQEHSCLMITRIYEKVKTNRDIPKSFMLDLGYEPY